MEFIYTLLDYFLYLDKHLELLVQDYDVWIYLILFMVIFAETGLVVMPLLPGDSLLFAAGTLAAVGSMNIYLLTGLLFLAAFLGDTVNYFIGKYIGDKIFYRDYKLIKKAHIEKTQKFFEKHGPKTIIIARFVPIVRTFAPFVAGIGKMNYPKFISYNITGGAVWVFGITFAGYFLGEIEWVKKNFGMVVIGIIIVSIMPMVIEYLKARLAKNPQVRS
jgi:membrane-associated protein